MKYVTLIAGPAGEALEQAVTCLKTFTDLVNGEEALLASAPDNIKTLTKELISKTKVLVTELTKEVGEAKPVIKPKEKEKI